MTSIHDLAKCILLDDVNDIFYRSLCFSSYIRSEYDAKSEMEKRLDTSLEQRLARQLNWSSSICSLDTATHKISHLLETLTNNQLSEKSFKSMLEDNYWLKSVIHIELGSNAFQQACADDVLLEKIKSTTVNKQLSHIAWKYFSSQMAEENQFLLQQVIELSESYVEQTLLDAKENKQDIDEDMAYHFAFINSYSFVVLLKLFDRAVQSVKHEALNSIALECEKQRAIINEYTPTAETLLSFMVFDEFLKPHVFDNLNLVDASQLNLINGVEKLDPKAKVFVRARAHVIVERLNKNSVLTKQQLDDFISQNGINFEVKSDNTDFNKSVKLWKKLLLNMPEVAPAI